MWLEDEASNLFRTMHLAGSGTQSSLNDFLTLWTGAPLNLGKGPKAATDPKPYTASFMGGMPVEVFQQHVLHEVLMKAGLTQRILVYQHGIFYGDSDDEDDDDPERLTASTAPTQLRKLVPNLTLIRASLSRHQAAELLGSDAEFVVAQMISLGVLATSPTSAQGLQRPTTPAAARFTADAIPAWEVLRRRIAAAQRCSKNVPPLVSSLLNKLHQHVLRVAGVIAFTDDLFDLASDPSQDLHLPASARMPGSLISLAALEAATFVCLASVATTFTNASMQLETVQPTNPYHSFILVSSYGVVNGRLTKLCLVCPGI